MKSQDDILQSIDIYDQAKIMHVWFTAVLLS